MEYNLVLKVKWDFRTHKNGYIMSLPDAPTVTIQQCSTPIIEDGNAKFYCNATGNPVPSTAWIRLGQVVTYDKMLVLPVIKRNESGSYKCLAWNGIGNNSTNSCTIDVQCEFQLFIILIVVIMTQLQLLAKLTS